MIIGPTATGKSKLAHKACQLFHGEILNADSLQVFKGVDIGTAKPTPEEQKELPHHLFDFIELGGDFTAGQFRKKALQIIEINKGPFFLVGGSGFYLQAFEKGLYFNEATSTNVKDVLQEKINHLDPHELWKKLIEIDPQTAQKLHFNDKYRIQRAIEVYLQTGVPLSQLKEKFQPEKLNFKIIKIGLKISKQLLLERINQRVQVMLEKGWIEEVVKLRKLGLSEWPPMKSIGYKEIQNFLDHQLSKELLIPSIVQSTMKLAKKQMTWFKRDPTIQWFETSSPLEEPLQFIKQSLKTYTS